MKLKFANALSLALIMAMLFTSIGMAQGTPTITSDLPDYAPGATVNLFGAGWGKGESVHIFVNDNVGSSWSRNADVVAADDGTFTDTFQLPDWFVATYSVTATGATSGTATTGFTDGTSNISFGIGPSSVVQGAPLTWNASATCAGPASGSSSCIASGTSVNGPVPNGYTVNVVYKLQASAITNPGLCQFNSGTAQADSQTTTGGSASGSFSAPATIGTYCYKAEHPNQNIGSFSWAAQNNSTNVIITVVVAPSDTTPPVISYTLNPASPNGNNGWYKGNVQLTWSVTDPESAVTKTGCVNQNIIADQAATTYSCSASSAGGSAGPVSVTIKRDATAPSIDPHGNQTAEATGAAGAVVNYTSPATHDAMSGDGVASCLPASGTQFALGTTTVNCSATDTAGNAAAPTSFTVTVGDSTAPVLTLPTNITQEAVGPSGNVVTYAASATDVVDGAVAVTCAPASGSTFPIAATTVDCAATDAHSNTANGSFSVTIADTTAPVIAAHLDVTAEATSAAGAIVNYTSPATSDAVDGAGTASCLPASGTQFALGDTTVTCDASDAAGNDATSTTFVVHVVDTIAPVITFVDRTAANVNGWNDGDVTVNWSCT